MIDTLNKLLDPMRRRVRLMISRAVLSAISDGAGIQLVQVKLLEGEVRDGVERFQNYAFTSVPLTGAEGIMACVSGNRDHGVIVAMDDRRYRIKGLQPGEAAMYTHRDKESHKHRIKFNDDGTIDVMAKGVNVLATEKIRLESDVIEINAASMFKFDVNGHGQKWLPNKVDTWQIGEVPGTAHNISPPEIP